MRDAINRDEEGRMVRALKDGKSWDEVRGMLSGVDPEAMDRGFKARCLAQAGLAQPEPTPEPDPAPEPTLELPSAPELRKKGRR